MQKTLLQTIAACSGRYKRFMLEVKRTMHGLSMIKACSLGLTWIAWLGRPRWDGSAAQQLLRDDMAAGALEELGGPTALRNTRPEYMRFSLKVFTDHINQEKTRKLQKSFWMNNRSKRN